MGLSFFLVVLLCYVLGSLRFSFVVLGEVFLFSGFGFGRRFGRVVGMLEFSGFGRVGEGGFICFE